MSQMCSTHSTIRNKEVVYEKELGDKAAKEILDICLGKDHIK